MKISLVQTVQANDLVLVCDDLYKLSLWISVDVNGRFLILQTITYGNLRGGKCYTCYDVTKILDLVSDQEFDMTITEIDAFCELMFFENTKRSLDKA